MQGATLKIITTLFTRCLGKNVAVIKIYLNYKQLLQQATNFVFNSHTVHLGIIKIFYLPTDAQENYFKKNIKIYIKTALTCIGFSPSSGSALFELTKVTVVKNNQLKHTTTICFN